MSTLRSRARLLARKIDAFGGDLRRANSLRPSISKSKGPPRDRISRGEMRHYLREVPGYQGGRYHRSLPHGADRGLKCRMSTLRSRARLLARKIDAFGGDLRRANSLRPSISKSKGPPRDRISRGEMRHYLREVPGYQGGRYHRSLPHGTDRGLSSLRPKWNSAKRVCFGEDEQRSKADIWRKTDGVARSLRGRPTE